MSIPLYDVAGRNQPLEEEFCRALRRANRSGRYVLGPELEAFEAELARFIGVDHVVGVNSGTDAVLLALHALGVGAGDDVVTSAFTYFATVEAILRTGATPVLVDIEPETLCLSPEACALTITERTRAVLLVHIYGHCGPLDRFIDLCSDNSIFLVEDAAQAIGSSWQGRPLGSLGHAGAFSFYPTKNLGALGDGGAVSTSSTPLADRVRRLRSHGHDSSGDFLEPGFNSRLDEIQAAFLRVQLAGLEAENARRRELAHRYTEALADTVEVVQGAEGCSSNHHQFAIRTPQRDVLRQHLKAFGIETAVYYPRPAYREPAYPGRVRDLPATEKACHETVCLPIRAGLTDDEQFRVIDVVRSFFS